MVISGKCKGSDLVQTMKDALREYDECPDCLASRSAIWGMLKSQAPEEQATALFMLENCPTCHKYFKAQFDLVRLARLVAEVVK